MNPEDPKDTQLSTLESETTQADVYNEPTTAPAVPPKKASAGLFVGLVFVGVVLFGAAGYFIWQTIENVNKGSTQQQTGGDTPNINGEAGPYVEPPAAD